MLHKAQVTQTRVSETIRLQDNQYLECEKCIYIVLLLILRAVSLKSCQTKFLIFNNLTQKRQCVLGTVSIF